MEIKTKLIHSKINKLLAEKKRRYKKQIDKIHKITGFNGSTKSDWSWNPPDNKIMPTKFVSRKYIKKKKRKKRSKLISSNFYNSKEWRRLRFRVLEKYEGCCMLCGRSRKEHGVVIHVDHIKPRSKHPNLSLVFENLQILCDDCNLGKSNKSMVDYRPTTV